MKLSKITRQGNMFTGIIETLGTVHSMDERLGNLHICLDNPFNEALKIGQSISHNGVCLSVDEINSTLYTVVVIEETLKKTNLGSIKPKSIINLERAMKLTDRFEGHVVQGHVDLIAQVKKIDTCKGSHMFYFQYDNSEYGTVEKGSIAVNGVSLTVVDSYENAFSVAIIPSTYKRTCFCFLKQGDKVNIEFDILGKYISKLVSK